jgi:cheR methyltransferase, SAM binding domain
VGNTDDLSRFVTALRTYTTYDLSDYSDRSLLRRLYKVLDDERLSLDELIGNIAKDASYGDHVVEAITVNTSELFRDPSVWLLLRSRIYPRFKTQNYLNIWHAGCSMGQEVYSNLMLLNELGLCEKARVYASDINQKILAAAQLGEYRYRFNLSYLDNFDLVINTNPLNYEEKLSVSYSKYFDIDEAKDLIRMHDFLRKKPTFRANDLVKGVNPFFVRYDVIFCRNVLIYFNAALQNKLFEVFYRNLYPGGILVLGAHESILGSWADRFERISQVYMRKD